MATIVTGKTGAEAKDRYEMLSRCVDAEGMLALYSGFSGMDVSKELGQRTGNNGMEGVVEYLLKEDKSLERLRKSYLVQMRKMAETQLAELMAAEQAPAPARPTTGRMAFSQNS